MIRASYARSFVEPSRVVAVTPGAERRPDGGNRRPPGVRVA
jgi:hypothetical protein